MIQTKRVAFTLVELLVVIAIIGLLSSVAVVATSKARDKAKLASSQSFEASVYRAAGAEIVGEWLFNEGSGTVVNDTSGNGYGGTATNMTWSAGINGGAGSFSGSSYVTLGSDAALNPENFTITAWVKPGDFSGYYNYIYSNSRDCCGVYNGIDFHIAKNTLGGAIWNGTVSWVVSNPAARISNAPVWTFVAFSYNGSKLALYINGHLVKTENSGLGVGQPASFPARIGGMGAFPNLSMHGLIDQVRLYGTAVIASEIRKIYLAEKDKYLAES